VFVEVRLRSRGDFGRAAGSVTAASARAGIAPALGLSRQDRREPACRFDVVLLDALDPSRVSMAADVVEGLSVAKIAGMIDHEKRIREHFAESARVKVDASEGAGAAHRARRARR
jgi:Holliday junction resolvase-like predicted endonuclease